MLRRAPRSSSTRTSASIRRAIRARRCATRSPRFRAISLITIDYESLRDLVMMAMSLADRPRPALLQVRSILKGQLFTFVWLPREELTTTRRTGDRQAARERGRARDHQLVGRARRRRPRAHPLHPIYRRGGAAARCRGARRGGRRDGSRLGAGGRGRADRRRRRAARDASRADLHRAFPDGYRVAHRPGGGRRRHPAPVRACRRRRSRRPHLALRIGCARASCASRRTARGGLIPLSEAVPVLENFGFRVLEEMPTALAGGNRLHPRLPRRGRRARPISTRSSQRTARDRARDRQRAVRRGRGRRVQPARALRGSRHAGRSSGSAPGSATCARPEAASAWSRSSMRCAARPMRRAR